MKGLIAYIIERECCVCGKLFEVRIDAKSKRILTECFYGGEIRLGLARVIYRLEDNPDGSIKFVRVTPLWKVLWYKQVNAKRLLLHQYEDIEYWECTECNKPKCSICEATGTLFECEECKSTICHREIFSDNPMLCKRCFNKRNRK